MKIEIIKEYVNVGEISNDIVKMYKDALSDYKGEKFYEELCAEYDNLEQMAFEMALDINEDMKKYLHSENYNIPGNFNNVKRDFEKEFKEDGFTLKYAIDLLDRGFDKLPVEMFAIADKFLSFLTSWFWETFGTYGMKCNISTYVGDSYYWIEKEYENSED